MKPAAIITIIASLVFASSANAAVGPFVAPKVSTPTVGLGRDLNSLTIYTTYDVQVGHTATITYTIKRHRVTRAGFKTVGTITRTVVTGNATDQFHVRFSRIGGAWWGFGYRVKPVIVDTTNNLDDTAHAGRIHL